jgi:hypothetical protein
MRHSPEFRFCAMPAIHYAVVNINFLKRAVLASIINPIGTIADLHFGDRIKLLNCQNAHILNCLDVTSTFWSRITTFNQSRSHIKILYEKTRAPEPEGLQHLLKLKLQLLARLHLVEIIKFY